MSDDGLDVRFCSHRWRSPRGDAPTSVPVEHVCEIVMGHVGVHLCPCGATEPHTLEELNIAEARRLARGY